VGEFNNYLLRLSAVVGREVRECLSPCVVDLLRAIPIGGRKQIQSRVSVYVARKGVSLVLAFPLPTTVSLRVYKFDLMIYVSFLEFQGQSTIHLCSYLRTAFSFKHRLDAVSQVTSVLELIS